MVRDILIVATLFDLFLVEEDGRFSDRLFSQYAELNLTTTPRLTRASTGADALKMLKRRPYDLVLIMTRARDLEPAELARQVKELRPRIPIALLAYDSVSVRLSDKSLTSPHIDRHFVWKGDNRLLLALVKSIEDLRNAPHDTKKSLVRVIIVVEDSPHYYSAFLPVLYTCVMEQTQSLIEGGINHLDRVYRMRARPKILLARTYEEGLALYRRYRKYVLAVISDMRLPRKGELDADAGLRLLRHIRKKAPALPLMLQTAEEAVQARAHELNAAFADKGSPDLNTELRFFLTRNCGFGDFIFRMPDGTKIDSAHNTIELRAALSRVPPEVLRYHGERNDISNWLMARGKISLALQLQEVSVTDFGDIVGLRDYVTAAFDIYLERRQRGTIVDFSRGVRHLARDFVRLGGGSLGGKGRGVAFMYKLLAHSSIHERYPDVHILVPRSTVICTDEFDRFTGDHNLLERCQGAADDSEAAQLFLTSRITDGVHDDLAAMLEAVKYPLAVRSSSLVEDSRFQPFAGVYATYILPNNHPSLRVRLRQLRRAIKLVYASTWSAPARAYMRAIGHRPEEEKMAVLIQRLIGTDYGDRFYPTLSGVAQSYNFYPLRFMEPTDGICVTALGLGRTVVGGGKALRFSPAHPQILPQMSSPDDALRSTQTRFWALNMRRPDVLVTREEEETLVHASLDAAELDGSLEWVGSTWSAANSRIYDTIYRKGARIVSMAPILKHGRFPLAEIASDILEMGSEAMGCAVEIEFAANLDVPKGSRPEFAAVQIRPLVSSEVSPADLRAHMAGIPLERVFLRSTRALGNGVTPRLTDVVFIPPERFDRSRTVDMVREVAEVNNALAAECRPYVLIGPGRWGTADHHLGIPVSWVQVSAARIIVELALPGFDIDPSQGTHFFHNITSLKVGYLAIDDRKEAEEVDWGWLRSLEPVRQLKYVTHVRLPEPIQAVLDGIGGEAMAYRSTDLGSAP